MSYNAENLTDHASNVENHVEISTASYHLNHAVIHGAQPTNKNHISFYILLYDLGLHHNIFIRKS
jgi:hypothetical protein